MNTRYKKSYIDGLKQIEFDEDTFFFNDEMLELGVFYKEEYTSLKDDKFGYEIQVYYIDNEKAKRIEVGLYLQYNRIDTIRVVKEIHEFYKTNAFNDFLEIMEDISGGGYYSEDQQTDEQKLSAYDFIRQSEVDLKTCIKYLN